MMVYPISINTSNLKCTRNTNQTVFRSFISHKEIQEIGNKYLEQTQGAKTRKEFYTIAKSYLKEGIIPIIEKSTKKNQDNPLRHEVVNMVSADIELSFDPELMKVQEELKHIGLKGERKRFSQIVKTVNKIIKNWKESDK